MDPIVVTRPLPVRIAAAATLAIITGWAALNRDLSDFGVLAYPAIIALQTAREWLWRLEVTKRGIYEKQGIGSPRDIEWNKVEAVVMPDSAWWRINPMMKIENAPNIQMTATEEVLEVVRMAQGKRKEVLGTIESISIARTLFPWIALLMLAALLFVSQLAGPAA